MGDIGPPWMRILWRVLITLLFWVHIHMGVFRFVFHVLLLLSNGFTWNNFCYWQSTIIYQQVLDWKSSLPWYNYEYQNCMVVGYLGDYISPPSCVHYQVWSIQLKYLSNFFYASVYRCLFIHPHRTTYVPTKYTHLIKKITRLTHASLVFQWCIIGCECKNGHQ